MTPQKIFGAKFIPSWHHIGWPLMLVLLNAYKKYQNITQFKSQTVIWRSCVILCYFAHVGEYVRPCFGCHCQTQYISHLSHRARENNSNRTCEENTITQSLDSIKSQQVRSLPLKSLQLSGFTDDAIISLYRGPVAASLRRFVLKLPLLHEHQQQVS